MIKFDEKLKKLKKFAKKNNIKLSIKKAPKGINYSGEADFKTKEITIYTKGTTTQEDIIWTLLHELSHALSFSYDKDGRDKMYRAFMNQDEDQESRSTLVDYEIRDIQKMGLLSKLLLLDIDEDLIESWVDYDIETYEYFRIYGDFPSRIVRRDLLSFCRLKNNISIYNYTKKSKVKK